MKHVHLKLLPMENLSIEDSTNESLCNSARDHIEKLFESSHIANSIGRYPRFHKDEIVVGAMLGKGVCGAVYEVSAFKLLETEPLEDCHESKEVRLESDVKEESEEYHHYLEQEETRAFIAEHCKRDSGEARYAIKLLNPETSKESSSFLQALIDMAIETRMLSDMEHPNIVKLRAVPVAGAISPQSFIIMDRLYDTLEKRFRRWDLRLTRITGMPGKLMDLKGKKKKDLHIERLQAAFDLSAALSYLHERRIIYRDLKPENVGFDVRDDVKIFDFGLAIELKEKDRNKDGTFNLTEKTGSPNYMAPEVANGLPYNQTCDSYSFAILLWQIMSLAEPFFMCTSAVLRAEVHNGKQKRPPIKDKWPTPIKEVLTKGWAADLHKRLEMAEIAKILRNECVAARDGDDAGLSHERRRSTFVYRRPS